MLQKAIRMGMAVRAAQMSHRMRPPPILLEKYHGTTASRVKRRPFEKWSLLGPSAGSGAFLMAGDCLISV
jgi:hypothetical protein